MAILFFQLLRPKILVSVLTPYFLLYSTSNLERMYLKTHLASDQFLHPPPPPRISLTGSQAFLLLPLLPYGQFVGWQPSNPSTTSGGPCHPSPNPASGFPPHPLQSIGPSGAVPSAAAAWTPRAPLRPLPALRMLWSRLLQTALITVTDLLHRESTPRSGDFSLFKVLTAHCRDSLLFFNCLLSLECKMHVGKIFCFVHCCAPMHVRHCPSVLTVH